MGESILPILRKQVEYIYTIKFYKEKMDRAGVRPNDIKTLDDFTQLPFTSPVEMISELKKSPSSNSFYSESVTRINFSPSGKELYPIFHTNNDLERMHKVCSKTLTAAGLKQSDICAVTFGYHLFIAGLFYQGQLEAFGAKVIPLGPGESERAWKVINDYGVSVLISNPSFAVKLASKGLPTIRVLFVGGEPFSSVEGYAEKIREAFGRDITIIDSYSMALCMPVARSCQYESGLHIVDDFVYAEVVDPVTGLPVKPGEKGELVLTHLYKEAAPLLRYRTGDLTVIENKACSCGRSMTLPKGIIGRTDEMVKVKGVKFWPSQIGTILQGFSFATGNYRVVFKTRRGVDFVELFIEGSEYSSEDVEKLEHVLRRDTLVKFNEIVIVEKLEPGPRVVDERNTMPS